MNYLVQTPTLLVVTGRPGSGKDTQADQLAEQFNYALVKASAELDTFIQKNPDDPNVRAIAAAKTIGDLAPDQAVVDILLPIIQDRIRTNDRVLSVGFPRTPIQHSILQERGIDSHCLHLEVPEDIAIQRILTGNRGRLDDQNEDIIRKRMSVYVDVTAPVIEAYEEVGELTIINVTDPKETADSVQARVRQALIARFSLAAAG